MEEINDSSNISNQNDSSSYYSGNEQFSIIRTKGENDVPLHRGMRYYDPKTYVNYPFLEPLKNYTIKELIEMKQRYKLIVTCFDTALVISNIISFFLGYSCIIKSIYNDNTTIDNADTFLYLVLAFAIISIICVIVRILLHIKEKRILYLMNITDHYHEGVYYRLLVIESLLHLIQPYPWLKNVVWDSYQNDHLIRHSLNAYLLFVSLVRIYTLVRFGKKFSTFSNERAKRMLSYFNINDDYHFILKSKIRNNDALFFGLIFLAFLFVGGCILQILESLVDNQYERVSYITTTWDLALMILTISFNNGLTQNPVSNILKAIFTYIGLFMLTVLILNFLSYIHLDQDEEKAYKVIDIVKNKSKNGFIKKYMDEFIKYKAMKMKKSFDFQEFYMKKQAFLIIRQNTLIKMKQCLSERYEIDDFANGILTKRATVMEVNNNKFINELRFLEKNVIELKEKSDSLEKQSKDIKLDSNRIYNLGKIMTSLGSFARLRTISNIKGKEILTSREVALSLREFQVKYKDRSDNGNEVIMNAKYQDQSTEDGNSSDLLSFEGSSDCE